MRFIGLILFTTFLTHLVNDISAAGVNEEFVRRYYKDAGVVGSERQGLWAYYYVFPNALQELTNHYLGRDRSFPRAARKMAVVFSN